MYVARGTADVFSAEEDESREMHPGRGAGLKTVILSGHLVSQDLPITRLIIMNFPD